MKKILVACGAGVCTSTAVLSKMKKILDDNGFKGQYELAQCKIAEVPSKSSSFDLCVATTMVSEVKCPFIMGIAFLTGRGLEDTVKKIFTELKK
ncbi:PTS sugar transporter subunit IIB [Pectinatus haikarae]|uniref:PTS system galactitol-specific IIB component n=1 Tax=Pectinatus haikarae TaxID=349096 RepID=A0ABT9YB45_9FIRM|nr:PTS sugar transporter subunit IIB [Pectinatus haikarae]MDQ0205060.1 PTS system galactitol-specific IIB component [Pectinatus haikarae]